MLYRSYLIKKAIIMVGEKDTGKSTILNMMIKFIGMENASNVSLQDISNPFKAKYLYHRHLNYVDEMSTQDVEDVSRFKIATGGSPTTGEHKFGADFQFYNYAKMIFGCNRIPSVKEKDDLAYFGRWMVIQTRNLFKDDNVDNTLRNMKWTDEEMSGLLNICMKKLKKLLREGKFSYSLSDPETRDIMLVRSSSIAEFVYYGCEEEPDKTEWLSKKELYESFVRYARRHDLRKCTQQFFTTHIRDYCNYVADSRDKTAKHEGWRHIRVKLA